MKTIKKILKISLFSMIMIFSMNTYSNHQFIYPKKEKVTIRIPVQAEIQISDGDKSILIYRKFSKKLNGYITITSNSDLKFFEISFPDGITDIQLNAIQESTRGEIADCTEDCGGTWACFAACVLDRLLEEIDGD